MIEKKLTDPTNPAPAAGQPCQRHLKALTSIRFLAALYVALYHFVRPFSLWGPLEGFMSAGYTGVSFFFFLSGYILTYSHAGETVGPGFLKRFYFARFARVYPAYLLVLVYIGYLSRSTFVHPLHVVAFLMSLFMVQTWSIRAVNFFNIPGWSVSSEAFFYLVFPLLVARLRPSSRMRAVMWAGSFWGLAMLFPLVSLVYFPAGAWHETPGLFDFWVRRFPPFALPEFLAGISVGWVFVRFRPALRAVFPMLLVGIPGMLAALFFSERLPAGMLHNGLLIPFYALILLGLSEDTVVARMLSFAPLLLLGEASYALYLTHFLFNVLAMGYFHWDSGVVAAAYKLAMVVPLSIAIYILVERPCRKGLLRWWNGRNSRAQLQAAAEIR